MRTEVRNMRTLLLHNPTAGAAHPNTDELMGRLYAAGFSPHYQSSKDGDYREALAEDWDLVVVAGGAGTGGVGRCFFVGRTTPKSHPSGRSSDKIPPAYAKHEEL